MFTLSGLTLGTLLLCCAGYAHAVSWRVSMPHAGNPLKRVGLDGAGWLGPQRFAASLLLSCRADQPVLRAQLALPAEVPGRALSLLEGPEGAGLSRPVLAVRLSGRRRLSAYPVSGARAEDERFFLGWTPDRAFIRWLPAGRRLHMALRPVRGAESTLWLRFELPADSLAMREALRPCLKEVH